MNLVALPLGIFVDLFIGLPRHAGRAEGRHPSVHGLWQVRPQGLLRKLWPHAP